MADPEPDTGATEADHTGPVAKHTLTPQRSEILERLHEVSQELSEVYQAALRLQDEQTFPARGRLLAHCAREVMNRLPDHLDVPIEAKRVEYDSSLDAIAVLWEDETHRHTARGRLACEVADNSNVAASAEMTLSNELHARIDRLVKDHLGARTTMSERVTGVLQPPEQSGTPFPNGQLETFVRQWKDLGRWFVGHAHVPKPGKSALDFGECESHFETLEHILYTRLCPFYGAVEELDDILEETNRPTS